VNMVKHGLNVMTLSIGDGANDVAMIQEADVGVGIAGEEGRQAVMSSDYAIGQFRFLTRLMLVHGRWDYRRMSETIANFFYKNIVWTFCLFWYQIYTNFDISYIFDYTYVLLYNLAFSSLPVIFMGILDQDVDDKVSLAVPQLYRRGIERLEWTEVKFWTYMIDGLYQSIICFYFTYLVFEPATFNSESGRNVNDYKRMGVYIANPAVFVVNFYILLNTYRWDWFMVLITAISILLVWFWTGVYTAFTSSFTFYQSAPQVYGQLSYWCTFLLTITVCLAPRFAAKAFQKIYMPYDIDIVREQMRQGKFDYLHQASLADNAAEMDKPGSTSSSENSKPIDKKIPHEHAVSEDMRPIYPPSVAPTATTHNARSQNGSDGTDYTGHSIDRQYPPAYPASSPTAPTPPAFNVEDTEPAPASARPSMDRPRPSFDRLRSSMDRTRPSFEASRDFTSAAYLSRVESSQSRGERPRDVGGQHTRESSRRRDVSDDLLS
ncbi:aminophospholipid-translocating P4-type ATPase, partial [Hortaea werneckii]